MPALRKFVSNNIQYPEKARLAKIQGTVILNFIVEVDGTLTDIKLLKEIPNCPECGEEAIRVTKLMPKWLPAMNGNKAIRSNYMLPIRFSL